MWLCDCLFSTLLQTLQIQIFEQAKKKLHTYGGELIVRWIPSHNRIEGNKMADKAPKEAATNAKNQTAWQSFLSYVKRKITKAKYSEIFSWHQVRKTKKRKKKPKLLYIPPESRNSPSIRTSTKEVYLMIFPAQSRAQSNKCIPEENKDD